MRTYGSPVTGATKIQSVNYVPQEAGEQFALYYEMKDFILAGGLGDSYAVAEAYVLDQIISQFNATSHWAILYVEVHVNRQSIPKAGLYLWDANGVVHVESINFISITTAIVIIVLALGTIAVIGAIAIVYRVMQFIGIIPDPDPDIKKDIGLLIILAGLGAVYFITKDSGTKKRISKTISKVKKKVKKKVKAKITKKKPSYVA